jgi:hypothetical protein
MSDRARRRLLRSQAVREAAPEVVEWLRRLLFCNDSERSGEPTPQANQAVTRSHKKTTATVHVQK